MAAAEAHRVIYTFTIYKTKLKSTIYVDVEVPGRDYKYLKYNMQ